MVKKLTLIFLLISLTSCNKHYYFTKDNNNIVYKNFNDSILDLSECNFQSFRKINLKIFSLENIDNKNYIKMFDKITFRKLFISQENAFNDFNKRRHNDDDSYLGDIKEDTTNKEVTLTPFGKISLTDGIDSYIVLKYSHTIFGGYNKQLILYNIKQSKLCSVVELVFLIQGNEGPYCSKTQILKNKIIEQIKSPSSFFLSEESIKYLHLKDVWDRNKFESYTFSTYNIDKNGYVRLVN